MSKYSPLGPYLQKQSGTEVAMTFAEIEKVVGHKLPQRSQQSRAWWSNNPDNSVLTKVWLDAGFRSERVDMKARKLVFRRVSEAANGSNATRAGPARGVRARKREGRAMAEQERRFDHSEEKKPRRHPMFGALKGTFTIAPGTDLTEPAWPEWADFLDEKYGKELKR